MNEFKVGDKVRVIDADDFSFRAKGLELGAEHTVTGIVDGHVQIDGGGFGYLPSRFEVVNTPDSPNEEMVAHPNHYGGDTTYEVIKVIEAWELDEDAYLFNTIKYVARAKKKGKQLEDLEKAAFYLNRRIEQLKGQ